MVTTEGTGGRGSGARNAPRGSVVCLGNEAPSLSTAQGAGLPPPHMPAPASVGTGRDSHRSKCAPVCHNCLIVPTTAATRTHTPRGRRTPARPERVSVPWSAAAYASSRLGMEQTPESGAHAEVGSKPKQSPWGSATKEEGRKPLLAAAHAVD